MPAQDRKYAFDLAAGNGLVTRVNNARLKVCSKATLMDALPYLTIATLHPVSILQETERGPLRPSETDKGQSIHPPMNFSVQVHA